MAGICCKRSRLEHLKQMSTTSCSAMTAMSQQRLFDSSHLRSLVSVESDITSTMWPDENSVPDRISLVDSPIPYTPAIISAIRSAISAPGSSLEEVQQTPIATQTEHSNKSGFKTDEGFQDLGALPPGTGTYRTSRDYSRKVARNKNLDIDKRTTAENCITVKDEAWVAPGVYGFTLDGLSVFASKGTSDFKYDS